ncbi:MAG: HD-GYP domain-containing protein [Thiogranum sp.]|nr:HD-GYP domain-containing protein [Thiogranum sp.]
MKQTERKISVEDLEIGMYVSRLDRPWVETRFLFQGFRISNDEDLQELRKVCEYVFVDPESDEATATSPAMPRATRKPSHNPTVTVVHSRGYDKLGAVFRSPPAVETWPVVSRIDKEMEPARQSRSDSLDVVSSVITDLKAGRKIALASVRDGVSGMIDSIIRNPAAFLWLTRLKNKDSYAYAHSVDACGLAVAFGRYLGFSRAELENLAIGTLLFDIGKLQLPESLLTKPGRLSEQEHKLILRHVEFGVDIARDIDGVNEEVLSVIAHHHERHDGSGYPRGLPGHKIPVNGRIAALVDCYDAITSDRPYSPAMSTYDAIQALYEWRDKDFQADMVEQFIQCIGLYPTGTLVEMSTGEVGIVLEQNRVRRLRPQVMLLLDKDKYVYEMNPILDLIEDPLDAQGRIIEIRQPLPAGSYGINAGDYYL